MSVCMFPDCAYDSRYGNGLCSGHNMQQRRGKPLKPLKAIRAIDGPSSAALADPNEDIAGYPHALEDQRRRNA